MYKPNRNRYQSKVRDLWQWHQSQARAMKFVRECAAQEAQLNAMVLESEEKMRRLFEAIQRPQLEPINLPQPPTLQ